MTWMRSTVSFTCAAAAVAAVAFATGVPRVEAAPRNDQTRQLDTDRDLRTDRGPFFGLRVNSMDVRGQARTISCLDYSCPGIRPGSPLENYQLVRHAFLDVDVAQLLCDEILVETFRGHDVTYAAYLVTTRWMRRQGPSDTPIGGFVGQMKIYASFVAPAGAVDRSFRVHLITTGLVGTTGMKPGLGEGRDRCDTPLHDEGYYQGYFEKKGLRKIQRALELTDGAHLRVLKVLAGVIIAGTFEGEIEIADDSQDPLDYCNIAAEGFRFDGLIAYKCKPSRPVTDRVPPEDRPIRDRRDSLEDALRNEADAAK